MSDLNERIAAILVQFTLPSDQWSIERVREDVEIAQEAARDTAALKLPKQEAIDFVNAAKLMLRTAQAYGLAKDEELRAIRRLGKQANVRLAVTARPISYHWLGSCAANFRGAWEALTANPSGLHYGDEPSPALKFVTACCRIVDESINESAVLRAYRLHAETKEMTPEEYEEFCQSDLWRELSRSDL